MKKDELMKRVLNNTSIAELIAIINNEEITADNLVDESRIAFVKKNIKSIKKNLLEIIVKSL